jgi:hypothetical protein
MPPEDPEPEVPDPDPEPDPEAPKDPEDPDPPDHPEDPEDPSAVVDHSLTGHHHGFTVQADETVEVLGEVTTDANVVVYGTLRMRPGSSLTFVDVDENAFVGPGDVHAPVEEDVGLWVFGHGQLDIQGTPKQGWNRTGDHETWNADDEYIAAPNGKPGTYDATPWRYGEEVPCIEFGGVDYCTEIANLTRDVVIQGTQSGKAHVFIRSHAPQTIKHALLRYLGPNGDAPVADGRYALHLHMMHEGSRGSIIEGVVARDIDDHTFVPHHSDGVTFRDTVAYDVANTPYWWDHGEHTNDTLFEHALAVTVHKARNSGASLTGFRMGTGVGNACIECAAAGVRGGRPSSGFAWNDGRPNKWEFRDSVAHNNHNGVYHWRNETFSDEDAHYQHGFVTYNNNFRGIEQGAYTVQSIWTDVVSFGNSRDAIVNRAHPRHGILAPGIAYIGGTLGGGGESAIKVSSAKQCPRDSHVLWEDLWLVDWDEHPIEFNMASCMHETGRFDHRFRDVVLGPEKRDLERGDFNIRAIPPDGIITVFRTDGTSFTIEH